MLQHLLGRDNFRRSIQLYLERNMFATVETWDLQKAIIDATGINMDWFFDQWIHRGGEPKLKVSTQNAVQNGENGIEFTVEQVQKIDPIVGVFKIPTDIAIYFKDGSVHRQTVVIDKAFQKFFVPTKNKEIAFKLFDEGSFVLKEIEFTKSPEELLAQLVKAENMLDRYDALLALKGISGSFATNENAKKAYELGLINAWQKETYKEMRAEIANQILNIGNLPLALYTQIATDKTTEVRRAFVNKAPINEETKALFEAALTDSSYLTIEAAILKMWNHPIFQNKHNSLLDKIKSVDGYTHNIKIRYCELACETYPDMKGSFIGALVDMSSDKYEFRTRILAMQALQRLNFLNDDLVLNLFEGMTTFNSRLNSPAIEVATYFNKQTQYARLFAKVLQAYSLNATTEAQKANEKKIRRILGY
jgi:aminopeptidase N